jgi:hypothetical protein
MKGEPGEARSSSPDPAGMSQYVAKARCADSGAGSVLEDAGERDEQC